MNNKCQNKHINKLLLKNGQIAVSENDATNIVALYLVQKLKLFNRKYLNNQIPDQQLTRADPC